MNIELTQEQTQAVINSQATQIAYLTKRLRRGHVNTKYLERTKIRVDRSRIQETITHIYELINRDRPDDSNDFGFEPQYDHDVLYETIKKFDDILSSSKDDKIAMLIFSFEYQFIVNGHDEQDANNFMSSFKQLCKELKHDNEPDTPNFFSSNDVKNGL